MSFNEAHDIESTAGRTNLIAAGLVVLLIVVGLLLVKDYGVSIDEADDKVYAAQMVQSYLGRFDPLDAIGDKRFYGPFSSLVSTFVTKLLVIIPIGLEPFQAWHLTYYFAFTMGCASLYYLLLRYVGWKGALAGTALFASQPLLFGQAFFNSKDTPTMAYFTLSIALGLYAVKGLEGSAWIRNSDRGSPRAISGEQHDGSVGSRAWSQRAALVFLVLVLFLTVLDLLHFHWTLAQSVRAFRSAYNNDAPRGLQVIFGMVAQDAWKTPLEAYLPKLLGLYVLLASVWISILILAIAWLAVEAGGNEALLNFVHRNRSWMVLLVAGVSAGASLSIRVAGLFAIVLIAWSLVWNYRLRGVLAAAIYVSVAGGFCVATWPFLWHDTFSRLLSALEMMSRFPHNIGVLFRGTIFHSTQLPWEYPIWLMLIQFTLPVFPLAVLGLYRWGVKGRRRLSQNTRELVVLAAWFSLPMLAFVVLRPTLYGGIRQLLFVTPPLFVFAGLGIQGLFDRIGSGMFQVVLTICLCLPALIGIVRLHPYEYVYYNALVRGTGGAFGSYEMDYLCTSLREATLQLNQLAAPHDRVAVLFRGDNLVSEFARPDLHVKYMNTVNDALQFKPNEIMFCSSTYVFDRSDQMETVGEVVRQGAVLSKIMKLRGQ